MFSSQSSYKVLIAALLFCGLLYLLGPILAPFILGAVLAYLCDPIVTYLERRKFRRATASLFVVFILCVVITLLILLIVPLLWKEGRELLVRLPAMIDLLQDQTLPWLSKHLGIHLQYDAATIRDWLSDHWPSAGGVIKNVVAKAGVHSAQFLGQLATLLLVPVVMFYLLVDWPRLLAHLESLVPPRWLPDTLRITREIDSVLAQFVRGQLTVMVSLAVIYSLGLWIAGVSFALPVGVITGLLVFIPYVGYGLGLLLAIIVALLQMEGWPPLIGVAVVYTLGQALESFVLTPLLVGERIGLHPLMVIFAVMAFGQLFGFTGVLVALPVSAVLLVAVRELRLRYLTSQFYQQGNV